MAKRIAIPSKEVALKVVGPKNSLLIPRVQRLGLDTTSTATDVDELGNPSHTGTTLSTPETTMTFSTFDVGIKLFALMTGTSWTAYPAAGVDISNLGEIDAIVYIKDATLADYVKTAHAKRLQIRDFTFTYNVDGDSTEDYSAIGSEKRWFKNDVVVDLLATGTSLTLSQTPIQLKNGNKLLSVIADGVYLTEVASGPAAGEYSVSGTTLTLGTAAAAQTLAVYHASPAGNNWTNVGDTSMPASIKGRDVNILIGANSIERVQSVTINGNLRPEAVREIGSRTVVGYQRQVPTVEGTINVLDTDTELVALLTTGSENPADTEFIAVESACAVASGISLEVRLLDPCDTVAPYTVLKTVYIPNITIVGDSYASNVNGNATQNFNFRSSTGECIVYSGSR